MQTRLLGSTGLRVGVVGFGGTWISQLDATEAHDVVKRAVELGVNYFDTARWDGDSEDKLGAALGDVRDQCVIATKTGSRTKRESLCDLRESMQKLRTDRLDIIQLHGIDDEKTLDKAMSEDGALQTCRQARKEGLVDFIGITGHKPRVLVKAIGTGEFDTVLVPLNVVTRQALDELLPLAKELDVGVVVMKPFSAKTSNLVTCAYQPSLSLLSDEPELKTLLGADNEAMVKNALGYVLAQDVSVVVPGFSSVQEVEVAAKVGWDFAGLPLDGASRLSVELGDYCRDCGECFPCPRNLNVAAILRFYLFSEVFGLMSWARKLYRGLEMRVEECDSCGLCESRCPYGLAVLEMLRKAGQELS